MVTAEAAYCALGASNTRVHCLPTAKGIDYRIINGRVYIGGERGDRSGRDRASAPRSSSSARSTTTRTGRRLYDAVEGEDEGADRGRAGAAEAVRCPSTSRSRPRARRPRHRLQPRICSTSTRSARGILPDVAPPLRVPAARLRRIHDVLRLLQEGLSGDQRPGDQPHGRGHGSGDLPAGRGSAAPGALRGGAGRQSAIHGRPQCDRDVHRRRSRRLAHRAAKWLDELETTRNPWFNVNVGDGFYHYHRSWNDDLSMPFAALPGYIRKMQGGTSHSNARSSS